jgi:hypothetical protein
VSAGAGGNEARATWETAFVAVGLLLGEPADAIERALVLDAAEAGAPARAASLRSMAGGSREARARAIARVVSEVAVALDATRLA